jgi:uncharacterized protein YndB with AHSA1/START domain
MCLQTAIFCNAAFYTALLYTPPPSQFPLHLVAFTHRHYQITAVGLCKQTIITQYLNKQIMQAANNIQVTISATINAPIEKVWNYYNTPEHVTQWNMADPSWHCPYGQNDLRTGGKFSYRMEAKDGSFGFDFGGVYDQVIPHQLIEYTMGDNRKVIVRFTSEGNSTSIETIFDAESQNPVEMQRQGWQAILDNFKKYTEAN